MRATWPATPDQQNRPLTGNRLKGDSPPETLNAEGCGGKRKAEDPDVYYSNRATECRVCSAPLEKGELIALDRDRKAACMQCAGLAHLEFLPSGDAALSMRARRLSELSVIVYRFSKARKRSERQGILVEAEALRQAQEDCAADADKREARRERERIRREKKDVEYVSRFTDEILRIYPHCPEDRAIEIANHACTKHSGRVGRSAAAKTLSGETVELAVRAHVRHRDTDYDMMLAQNHPRDIARNMIEDEIQSVLNYWTSGK